MRLTKTKRDHPSSLPIFLVSVFLGLASGVVGVLLAGAYLTPEPSLSIPYLLVPRGGSDRVVVSEETVPHTVMEASPALVYLYRSRPAEGSVLDDARLAAEAWGSGMVLTSDGWLVTHEKTLFPAGQSSGAELEAIIGTRSYEVQEALVDPYSRVAFLKIEADNMPVIPLGEATDLYPGERLFAFDAVRGTVSLRLAAYDTIPVRDREGLIRSSESIQRVLRLFGDDGLLPGSMLLNRSGEAVGIVSGKDELGVYAVPLESFSRQIGRILRDGQAARPYLGVHYVDVSRLTGAALPSGRSRGALLVSSASRGGPSAVQRLSPAAEADLMEGDLITAVNDEDLTYHKPLSDVIAEYEPGSTVTLDVVRGLIGEFAVEVTLGTVPTP
ncbi:hypothetical protein AMJ57_01745 [Parcubacteria bacterium SG8_24]|nr:MAG: hypothetical protein AMJ57_01745 [Parcubacteria bacterium SG8_24]